jgi:hypothetical protein
MRPRSHLIVTLCVILCLSTAGCSSLFSGDKNAATTDISARVPAGYRATISQPDARSAAVRMDADIYNAGEVVEFSVANDGIMPLSCSNTPPDFVVKYQTGSGRWVSKMGPEVRTSGTTSYLQSGESTQIYRFVTTGWEPGRYRIISDCGVSHEILIRALPTLTPAGNPCPSATNTAPYIRVNPISDQYPGKTFTISGTTNLPAGEELQYSIFAILPPATGNMTSAKLVSNTLRVAAGSCGVNTWSADGRITVSGDYFIGISNRANTVSAVKRFTVLENDRPVTTETLPEKTKAPGITTG